MSSPTDVLKKTQGSDEPLQFPMDPLDSGLSSPKTPPSSPVIPSLIPKSLIENSIIKNRLAFWQDIKDQLKITNFIDLQELESITFEEDKIEELLDKKIDQWIEKNIDKIENLAQLVINPQKDQNSLVKLFFDIKFKSNCLLTFIDPVFPHDDCHYRYDMTSESFIPVQR